MPGMILLEPGNRILEECVRSQILATGKREQMDVRLNDFDDVSYHVTVEKEDMNLMKVSIAIPCWGQIQRKGGEAALTKYYGDFVGEVEQGFDVSLHIKLDEVKEPEATVEALSLLKSNLTGGIFEAYFANLVAKEKNEKFEFSLNKDTVVYLCPRDDRVTIVMALTFQDKVDKVLAHVFMNEFVASKKKIGPAPPCAWGVNPPKELVDDFGLTENSGCLGYFTFSILPSHLAITAAKKDRVKIAVSQLISFRTYIQYHLKMSKSYFHSKMRARVVELIKVLNRAKVPDPKKEKKTASGKTFKR
jgi:actin related protein 2/3 complex subunit 2